MTLWISGQWVEGQGDPFVSMTPYAEDVVWQGYAATSVQVEIAVQAARHAFVPWKRRSFNERENIVLRFAERVKKNKELLAKTISQETGKPYWETLTEVAAMVGKVAVSIDAYHKRTGEYTREQGGQKIVLRHRPHGVMAVFGAYNFPCHLPNGHIVPALLAGNCLVFKPSELTPKSGELMAKFWGEAGLPDGVINLVQGGKETGIALAESSGIDGLLFTGSAATGQLLHQQFAGQTGKMLALEMGGNNPLIVSESFGQLDAAIYTILQSAFISSGQRCTCARRLYVPDSDHGDALLKRLCGAVGRLNIDQPFADPQPFMGPLISKAAVSNMLAAQHYLLDLGGKALLEAESTLAAFVTPALIDVTGIETLPDEEYFAPLLQIIRYSTLEEAVNKANETKYGLSAGLISTRDKEWLYFIDHIRAGIVNRNRALTGASSGAPFGGLGASGNLRPSAYYAADYCAYPTVSMEGEQVVLPEQLSPGISL